MEISEMKRYYVDFYDMVDGWGTFGFFTNRLSNNMNKATELCNKLNSELNENNKNCGEHYGVIDKLTSREIYCGMDEKLKKDAQATNIAIVGSSSMKSNAPRFSK